MGIFATQERGSRAIRKLVLWASSALVVAFAAPSTALADCGCGSTDPTDACKGNSVTYDVSGSQIGFEFTCDGGSCFCGQFANEHDYWVAPKTKDGEVKITRMTPNMSGSGSSLINGAEVDPSSTSTSQGLNGQLYYKSSLTIAPPYKVNTGAIGRPVVILKARSNPNNDPSNAKCNAQRMCLSHVETLTVVSKPPGNVFRPPYFGTEKPMVPLSDLDESILPALEPAGGEDSYGNALSSVTSVPYDHIWNWSNRERMHPRINYGNPRTGYDGYVAQNEVGAYLKMLLAPKNATEEQQRRLLIRRVAQRGIDYYHIFKNGGQDNHPSCGGWLGTGGYGTGRLPAVLLGNALLQKQSTWGKHLETVLATESGRQCFAETSLIQPASGKGKNVPLFGHKSTAVYNVSSGSKTKADPNGLVDGGGNEASKCISAYQVCCTTGVFRGGAMAVNLVPAVQQTMPSGARHWPQWVDRITTVGAYCRADSYVGSKYLTAEGYKIPGGDNMFFKYRECAQNQSCSNSAFPRPQIQAE